MVGIFNRLGVMKIVFVGLLVWAGGVGSVSGGERVRLDGGMLINLAGQRAAVELVDEQDVGGDPRAGQAGQPQTSYSNGWMHQDLYYPLGIVIDLGVAHALSDVCFYDVAGNGQFTVAWRRGDAWETLFVDDLDRYNQWVAKPVNVTTRYLQLTFATPGATIGEIMLYGTAQGPRPAEPEPVTHERPLMDGFIGTNGFVDDPVERLAACGFLREYHNWQWDDGNGDPNYAGYPDLQPAWSPSWVSWTGGAWDFDAFYQSLQDAGIEVSPCLQGTAPYLVDFDTERRNDKPILPGTDPAQPAAYIAHASYLFQFAARYGHTEVDAAKLELRADQQPRTGLGLVRYVENCNEPDKWWEGRAGFFTPGELAAMCSADYDGHRGSMGPTAGVKTADPTIQLVLGGLANPEIEYLKAMQLWADFHRDGEMPFDVINLHHYSNDAGGQGGRPTTGISPEADGLRERFARIVAWRDRYQPGKEVWVSEFGYDTNPKSTFRAPAIGTQSAEEVQAQWLIRSYLALAAAGVDRAQQFMLRDVNAENPVQFNSSGLTTEKWNQHQPKRSWYYVASLRHILADTRFDCDIDAGDAKVRLYRFASDEPAGRTVYAIWCPTAADETVEGFQLAVPGATEARLLTLEPDSATGDETPLAIEDGKVTVDVSERPAFVVVR